MVNWIDVEVRMQQHERLIRQIERDAPLHETPEAPLSRPQMASGAWASLMPRFAKSVRCSLERLAFALRLTRDTPCLEAFPCGCTSDYVS